MFVSSLSFGGVIQTRNWCCLWFEDGFGLVIVAVYEHGLESVNVFFEFVVESACWIYHVCDER
jgi:hypothetical protein